MIFELTCKNCSVSTQSRQYMEKFLNKITKELSSVSSDQIVLRFVIKNNTDKYYPLKKTYQKPAMAYFEGSITFRFKKNRFYARFKGATINECIKAGFGHLLKEVGEYRNQHYSSESDYPNRQTVRGVSQ